MLIVRNKAPAAEPLKLGGSAVLHCRPGDIVDREAAYSAAQSFFRKANEGAAAMADYGFSQEIASFDGDAFGRVGVLQFITLVELVMRCASRWEGVVDEARQPLALSRANVAALLRTPRIFDLVNDAVLGRWSEVIDEGNGSAPSQNGDLPAAPDTAAAVAT